MQIIRDNFKTTDMNGIFMPMIVVYKNQSEFPGKFVARLLRLNKQTAITIVKNTLPEIRMTIPSNMVCLPRKQKDDPAILEKWI